MYELPLFPLNTVLFPGMPLTLHIFEERYKLMIGQCIESKQPFGVVLISDGVEALGPLAQPHEVGCTAYITQVERLAEGRMNIGAIGRERFRIDALQSESPYLVGQVEPYPLDDQDPDAQEQLARRLRPWTIRYLKALSQIEGLELDPAHVPHEPITLAYLAATLLQLPAAEKQQLLVAERAVTLLDDLRTLYRREVPLVEIMFERQIEDQGTFSLN
jgi:Lon protease-like protein